MIKKKFAYDMYNRQLTFWYGTREELNEELAKLKLPGGDCLPPNCMGRYMVIIYRGYPADYILLVKARWAVTELSCLSHECLHFVCGVFKKVGIQLTDDSEEAFTYYLESTMRKCLTAIGKK